MVTRLTKVKKVLFQAWTSREVKIKIHYKTKTHPPVFPQIHKLRFFV